jgi:WD40 repeat protein
MQRLQSEGVACAAIDMTAIGSSDLTSEEWYASFIDSIIGSLELYNSFDLNDWWSEQGLLSSVKRLSKFIEEVLLKSIPQKIVIFIDEIDSILSLNFNIDDFFAVIRECYNKRAEHPDYQRLVFALLGVATPSDLIQDKRRTPFNVGRAIELQGFQLQEAQPLALGLAGKASNPQTVLEAVLDWTGGQPFLTQKVCKLILTAESSIPTGGEAQWVEQLVQSRIIENWEAQDEPEHLKTIRDRILRREQRVSRLLGLYQQILLSLNPSSPKSEPGEVIADDSAEQMELRLSGLVVKREGTLRIYNRIYALVFNPSWLNSALAELRPYAVALNSWIAANCQDDSRLLRGQALQDAQVWAEGKSLSDQDYQFLAASQKLEKREVEAALEAQRQANQLLAEAQRKAMQRIRIGSAVLAISLMAATVATVVAGKNSQRLSMAMTQLRQIDREKQHKDQELAKAQQRIRAANQKVSNAEKDAKQAQQKFQQANQKLQQADQKVAVANAELEQLDKETKQKIQAANQKLEQSHQEQKQAQKQAQKAQVDLQQAQLAKSTALKELEQARQEQQQAQQQVQKAQANLEQAQERVRTAQANLEQANLARQIALAGTQLEQSGAMALRQFQSGEGIEALLLAMQSGRKLKELVKDNRPLQYYPAISPLLALQTILTNIHEQNRFKGHKGGVWGISFSPNGKSLATGDAGGQIRVWNLSGQQILQFEGHRGGVMSISFSPDGQRLATAGRDGTARLWNLSGQQMAELKGHQGIVVWVKFSPNGQHLATSGTDGTARLWNLSGQQIAQFNSLQGEVWDVSFSPDGQRLATTGLDGTARLWDLSGKPIAELKGHQGGVWSVSFSSDGQRLATAGDDDTVQLWNASGRKLGQIKGNQNGVRGVSFSPDGKRLVTAGLDGTVKLWNWNPLVQSWQQATELKGHQGSVYHAIFSPNGQYLATASQDGTARLWALSDKHLGQFQTNQGGIKSVRFSPKGNYIATVGQRGTVKLWNPSGQQLAELEQKFNTPENQSQGSILVVPRNNLEPIKNLKSVDFSPDGQRLATAGNDGKVRLWSLSGQKLAEFQGHQGATQSVSFSPDGQRLATAGNDGKVRLWSLSGQKLAEFQGHQGTVHCVSFSPDGQRLATAGNDRKIRLWSLSGQKLGEFEGNQGSAWSVTFSPDGQHLAAVGEGDTALLWELSGKQIASLKGHQGRVWSVRFSPDGQRLVTGGEDGTVRCWDLNGRQISQFDIYQRSYQGEGVYKGVLLSASFSPDGQRIATAGEDGFVQFWPVEGLDELLEQGCNWLHLYLNNPNANLNQRNRRFCDSLSLGR